MAPHKRNRASPPPDVAILPRKKMQTHLSNSDVSSADKSGSQPGSKDGRPSILNKFDSNWMQLQATLKKSQPKFRVRYSQGQKNQHVESTKSPEVTSAIVLYPKNGDCSLTQTLAVDCEMVGVGHEGKRSALARVSLVNSWGNVVFDKHVRPLEPVTNFRTKISGVRARDLKKAEDFLVVQKEVADLINGRILVGHAVHNDLKAMYLSHPRKQIRDTSLYGTLRSKTGRPRALRDLAAEFLGVQIQRGEHNSIEDARAAMYIYQHFKKEWEQRLCRRPNSKVGLRTVSKKSAYVAQDCFSGPNDNLEK